MSPKIKNIIIFVVIGAVLLAAYFIFFNKKAPEANLTSSGTSALPVATPITNATAASLPVDSDSSLFLSVLLNVKNIRLDDSIFSDPAFAKLHDSSIELVPDGNEGRSNPFAPIGSDVSNTLQFSALITTVPVSNLNNDVVVPAPAVSPVPTN